VPITFPSNPSNADEYTFNGRTYTYNASRGVWLGSRGSSVSAGGGGGAALTVSDTAPTSANEGDLWFHSTLLETYVYYNSQWVLSNPSGSGGGSSGGGGTTTYATAAELPQTATNGDLALVEETDKLYIWNDTAWYNIALINTAPSITQGGAGSYNLAIDGTPTVITLTATDPESVPVTWSYAVTSGSLTNGGGTTATVTQADNVFTITPTTTEAYAGEFTLTFSVTDGANIVNDVNSFSLDFVTIVENSKYTTSLITTSTTAQNNGINDLTDLTSTYTFTGDPSGFSNWSPFKSGGYSTYFDGTGDYIHTDLGVNGGPDGDFTIEFWAYTTNGTTNSGWFHMSDTAGGFNSSAAALALGKTATNKFYYGNGSGDASTYTGNNVWQHWAMVRSGSTITLYRDGISIDTQTNATDHSSYRYLAVGGYYSTAYLTTGYISDFRYVKGTALYTANFTPPTERLTAVANTVLLTCASNTFKDDSTNTHTITTAGNPKISGFIPYDYSEYNKDDNIGSYYQNGSNNFTTTAIIPSSNYTIEGWVYVNGTNDSGTLMAVHALSGGRSWLLFARSDYIGMAVSGQTDVGLAGNYLNRWTHFAWTWDGTTQKMYINGVMSASAAVSSFAGSSSPLSFGFNLDNAPSNWYYQGYATNIRFSNIIRYTTDFDPLTESKKFTSDANTVLLVDPSEDQSIIDKSMQETVVSLGGNTTSSTTQTKYSSSSIYFDGSGDYISKSSSSLLSMGSEDYTVELWAYFNSLPTTSNGWHMIFAARDGSDNGIAFYVDGPTPHVEIYTNTLVASGATTLSTGQWYHLAYVRTNGTAKVFINGTEELSYSYTTSVGDATLLIAGFTSQFANMYIEDFRITKGLARYTTNFTPPTGSLEG
jgi:hypothetical protein